MAFDGIGWRDASLIYPNVYHPWAPMVGPALGGPLRAAYVHARNHGRMVIDQPYVLTFRDPTGWRDRQSIASATWVRIAEGFRWIHPEVTHLVGEAILSVLSAGDDVTLRARVVVTGGGNTDTGATVETMADVPTEAVPGQASGTVGSILDRFIAMGRYSPYGARLNTFTLRYEVPFATVTAGDVREVYVEAYATKPGGLTAPLLPQHAAVWTEIR